MPDKASILHLCRGEPDATQRFLMDHMSHGRRRTDVALYDDDPDYGEIVDLIFSHEKVVSWW